jgi:polar amino acid transport system permease protein
VSARDVAALLADWTPFLAGGFGYNLLISAVSMSAGTLIGAGLGWARGRGPLLRAPAILATSLARNVPSFVLLFYVAFLLPVEVVRGDLVVTVPAWVKAAIALTIPVIGFASDQTLGYLRHRAAGVAGAGAGFGTAWIQYLLIILMASATASVIGADEIVGRANRVIAIDPRPEVLLAVYLYVSAWFLAAGLVIAGTARLAAMRRQPRRATAPGAIHPG